MRRARLLLVVGLLALAPAFLRAQEHEAEPAAAEHAAEGHDKAASHEGHEAVPWYKNMDLWKFINLGVIVLIGLRMGGKAVGPALERRGQAIRTDLDAARAALEAAERRYDDAEFRLARLHDELEEMRQEGRRLADSEKSRIVADARAAAEEIGQKTRKQIEIETQNAKRELRRYMATLVVQRVRQDLQVRVEREGDAPFVRTILEKVEALPVSVH